MHNKRLRSDFYGLDIHYGKMNLIPSHNFCCFFIVEHTSDEEFIKKQALQLLITNCNYYVFSGSLSCLWKTLFGEVAAMIYQNSSEESPQINKCDNIEAFVCELNAELSCRPFIPCDKYLIYDDENLYQSVIEKLNVIKN